MQDWWQWSREAAGTGSVWAGVALTLLAAAGGWLANLFSLPGNWLIVLTAGLAMAFAPTSDGQPLIGWTGLGLLLGLAVLGEVVEFAAGAAGAAKRGASKRAVWMSVGGAMAGSIAGATAGIPVPLVGPLIGAVLGGGAGAFGGAYAGEAWKGTGRSDAVAISTAAFKGRLLGTAGKLAVGAVMLVCLTAAMFV